MKRLSLFLLSLVLVFAFGACTLFAPICEHEYDNACDASCNTCGEERSITHTFADADCTTAKTCTVCGLTDGSALGHSFLDGACTDCSAEDPDYVPHTHSYDAALTAPDCTNAGFTTYTCACGDS